MSLVERLAEKFSKALAPRTRDEEARWWLNAIADELDSWMALHGYGHHGASQLDWLRSQANPDSAESD